jgi:hypothetical protein
VQHTHWLFLLGIGGGERERRVGFAKEKCNIRDRLGDLVRVRGMM